MVMVWRGQQSLLQQVAAGQQLGGPAWWARAVRPARPPRLIQSPNLQQAHSNHTHLGHALLLQRVLQAATNRNTVGGRW